MNADDDVLSILGEIAERPMDQWPALLANRFPEQPAMARQALLWLHAGLDKPEDEAAPPSLGKAGDERYELMLRLASGATAAVWRAHDRKLGRNVAIKVFHANSEEAALELLEARAACDVISDHVVRVHDVHESGSRPYIVMELVAEHDAQRGELILGGAASSCRPRSIEEGVRWVMDVARGVRDAHLRNVFHRDLKPQNVLITPISRRARIADFGLALSAAGDRLGRSSSVLVRRGPSGPVSIAGTPEYMSPEQARGLPINLDPRNVDDRKILVGVDVWGLGALLYDLLFDRAPWAPTSRDDSDPWETAASGASPLRLHRTPRGERVPAALGHILEKAMAHEPVDRYASAGHVAGELEAVLGQQPTSFDQSSRARAALWCRRNPQLTVMGLVALALATLTLITYASVTRLREQRSVLAAEVAKQQSEEDMIRARASQTRAELERTKVQLRDEGKELEALETSVADEKKTYAALLAAKDKALLDANAATRDLVDQLEATRSDLKTMDAERAFYKQSSETARAAGERTAKERDQAQNDRDAARAEREAMRKERDAVAADRDQARAELDSSSRQIARLTAALAAANAKLDTAATAARSGSAGDTVSVLPSRSPLASDAGVDSGPSALGTRSTQAGSGASPLPARPTQAGSGSAAPPSRPRSPDPLAPATIPRDASTVPGDATH